MPLNAMPRTVVRARKLRRTMTLPEVILWQHLRRRPADYKFRRQCPIGDFVLDFACLETRLAIEVDGEAHARGDQPGFDKQRDEHLLVLGFATLRIPARRVLQDVESVLIHIVSACYARTPLHHPAVPDGPPPRSGEELDGMAS